MASTSDILSIENSNISEIHLYQEGIFWRAYNQSAYLFIQFCDKDFKLSKRFVKLVQQEVLSIGFPASSLDKYLSQCEYEYLDNKHIFISDSGYSLDGDSYFSWFSNIPLPESHVKQTELSLVDSQDTILDRLLSFRLEHKTALECLLFVSELQKDLLKIRKQ